MSIGNDSESLIQTLLGVMLVGRLGVIGLISSRVGALAHSQAAGA